MTTESAAEWYRFTCTRCGTWWIAHYQVRRFTDDAGASRTFYRRNGLPCEAPAHGRTLCPTCHAPVQAELLDHPATDTPPRQPVPGAPRRPGSPPLPGHHRQAGKPGRFKFRAVVALDAPTQRPARPYPSGTHHLMVRAPSLRQPGLHKYFPAVTFTSDGQPLRPGDKDVIVTICIADDDAPGFLGPGQPITLWNGDDMGHGTISRQVFNWPEFA